MTVLVTVSSFLFGAVVVLPLMLMLVCMPFMCVSFLDCKTSNQHHRIISYDRKCIGYLAFFSLFSAISGPHDPLVTDPHGLA